MWQVIQILILTVSTVLADPFEVDNLQNKTCILATMSATFVIPYKRSDGKVVNANLVLPGEDVVSTKDSQCIADKVQMILKWSEGFKLEFDFHMEENNKSWDVFGVKFDYNLTDSSIFVNASESGIKSVSNSDHLFKTKMNVAYLCNKDTVITLAANSENTININIEMLKLQASKFSGKDFSSEVNECSDDTGGGKKKDITVPIAVGATLGVLIVILIIAYFVGKRSSREYQSI